LAVLPLQNLSTLIQTQAATIQGKIATLTDFTVGSVLRALIEANAGVALWVQWLVLLVLRTTRLQTSTGTDVDTFVGDYGLTRLPAVLATGLVTFSRNDTTNAVFIPAGTTLLTSDGTTSFTVPADQGNAAYNATTNGFTIAAGTASIDCQVQAAAPGPGGNVLAGAISLLGDAIPGLDAVTNALALTNGRDAESDASLRARFALYIAGLGNATEAAIGSAIAGVQQGLTYNLAVNVDESGAYRPGHFVVTLDDGTGTPTLALRDTVYQAIDAVRAATESFSVQAPAVITVSVGLTLGVLPGFTKSDMQGPLAAAITAYIEALPVGTGLSYTRLAQVIYDAIPGIATVTGFTINSAQADIAVTASQVVKLSAVSIN
jgi:uncharacterized phage protein gp47/JayE